LTANINDINNLRCKQTGEGLTAAKIAV